MFNIYIYKKNGKQKMMMWLLIWLNMSVATLNVMLQLLVIYKYRCVVFQNKFS